MYISASTASGTGNFWVTAVQNVVDEESALASKTPYSRSLELLQFAPDATVVGVQFESIFEYTDIDRNGKFTPGVDRVLQSYELARDWKAMAVNKTTVYGGNVVGTLSFETTDNLFSFRIETSNAPDAPLQPDYMHSTVQIRQPGGARVVFHASNFTFQGSMSRLGIKTIILSPESKGDASGFRKYAKNVDIATLNDKTSTGYFSWTPTAFVRLARFYIILETDIPYMIFVIYNTRSTQGPRADNGLKEEVVQASDLINANYQSDIGYGIGKSTLVSQHGPATIYSEGEAQVLYFTLAGDSYNPSEFFW